MPSPRRETALKPASPSSLRALAENSRQPSYRSGFDSRSRLNSSGSVLMPSQPALF